LYRTVARSSFKALDDAHPVALRGADAGTECKRGHTTSQLTSAMSGGRKASMLNPCSVSSVAIHSMSHSSVKAPSWRARSPSAFNPSRSDLKREFAPRSIPIAIGSSSNPRSAVKMNKSNSQVARTFVLRKSSLLLLYSFWPSFMFQFTFWLRPVGFLHRRNFFCFRAGNTRQFRWCRNLRVSRIPRP